MAVTTMALISLACLIVIVFGAIKLSEMWVSYRKSKFRDERAEFMSDLSKLSYKWESRGCTDFSRAARLTINAWYISQDKDYPQTQYGKSIYEALKKIEEEELRSNDE